MAVSCSSSFSWYSRCDVNVMYYSASTSSVWLLKEVKWLILFISRNPCSLNTSTVAYGFSCWDLTLSLYVFPYDWRCSKEFSIERFQLRRNNWRTNQLKKLQGKWDCMLRQYKHHNILSSLLPSNEARIGNLQDWIAEIESLKVERIWLEQNQKSPGFIKRLIKTQESQRYILVLYHLESSDTCLDQSSRQTGAEYIYFQLYPSDPPFELSIDGPNNTINGKTVLFISLACTWRSHWECVFRGIEFSLIKMLRQIRIDVYKHISMFDYID